MPYGKSAAIFGFELFGEVLYKICAIVGALLALLFLFEDALAQVPVHLHALEIDTAHGVAVRGIDFQRVCR